MLKVLTMGHGVMKDVFRTVAVMNVEINHRHALQPRMLQAHG
ncbi:MAG: hypothetical protein M5R42_01405 [Rhodocyclaceae bacterium]|nr:hypothetical protein [Rhodocyclaceae bacterium]